MRPLATSHDANIEPSDAAHFQNAPHYANHAHHISSHRIRHHLPMKRGQPLVTPSQPLTQPRATSRVLRCRPLKLPCDLSRPHDANIEPSDAADFQNAPHYAHYAHHISSHHIRHHLSMKRGQPLVIQQALLISRNLSQLSWPLSQPLVTSRDLSWRKHYIEPRHDPPEVMQMNLTHYALS